jgi:hypothetical protein
MEFAPAIVTTTVTTIPTADNLMFMEADSPRGEEKLKSKLDCPQTA